MRSCNFILDGDPAGLTSLYRSQRTRFVTFTARVSLYRVLLIRTLTEDWICKQDWIFQWQRQNRGLY